MNVHATRMTVPEFLAWAERQPRGRYELWNGQPVEMSPERAEHAEIKLAIAIALKGAIKRAGLDLFVLPDGMTVRIDERTAYKPDALVYRGPKIPGKSLLVPEPVVLVEVASPSTARADSGVKLDGYFLLPSVLHYLIINPEQRSIMHYARRDKIRTAVIHDGQVHLDPPGIRFDASEAFAY